MSSADGGIAKDHDRYWRARAVGKCVQHGCSHSADGGVYCKPCAKKRRESRYHYKNDATLKTVKEYDDHIRRTGSKTVFEVECILDGLLMDTISGLKTGGDVIDAIKKHAAENAFDLSAKNAGKIYKVRRNKNIVEPKMWVGGLFK